MVATALHPPFSPPDCGRGREPIAKCRLGAGPPARLGKTSSGPIKQWRETKKYRCDQHARSAGKSGHWCGRLRGSAARRAQRKRQGDGVDGRRYSAKSRHGAANELARVLVSAGVPDQPVEIRQVGIKGCATYRSLQELASWAYEESATVPLRRVRWKPRPDFSVDFRGRDAQNRGETPGR